MECFLMVLFTTLHRNISIKLCENLLQQLCPCDCWGSNLTQVLASPESFMPVQVVTMKNMSLTKGNWVPLVDLVYHTSQEYFHQAVQKPSPTALPIWLLRLQSCPRTCISWRFYACSGGHNEEHNSNKRQLSAAWWFCVPHSTGIFPSSCKNTCSNSSAHVTIEAPI